MRHGLILSDLHLFAQRSDPHLVESTLNKTNSETDFIVLNGDIIDFRWSHHNTQEDSIRAGVDWLRALHTRAPQAKIFYVMGNHDCAQPWAEALQTLKSNQFDWSPTHFRIGNSLFVHGDLPIEGKNPYARTLKEKTHAMPAKPLMNPVYETFLQIRGHKAVGSLFTPKLCAKLIGATLKKFNHPDSQNVEHLYFGHTHNPFTDFKYNNITYHNTGSAIRLLKSNAMKITLHD